MYTYQCQDGRREYISKTLLKTSGGVVNAYDIASNKLRSDMGITYQAETERLIDAFKEVGLLVSSVVLSFYHDCFL